MVQSYITVSDPLPLFLGRVTSQDIKFVLEIRDLEEGSFDFLAEGIVDDGSIPELSTVLDDLGNLAVDILLQGSERVSCRFKGSTPLCLVCLQRVDASLAGILHGWPLGVASAAKDIGFEFFVWNRTMRVSILSHSSSVMTTLGGLLRINFLNLEASLSVLT